MPIPNVAEVALLTSYLYPSLTIKLYSNDITPAETDSAATYNVVTGGGYADLTLTYANWVITGGDPSSAVYPAIQFTFTGPSAAPSTVYGYYILDSGNVLRGSERFPESVVPFYPITGSIIRITPKLFVS